MSDRDFEIGTRKFKLRKLDAFKQAHILRRVGPIINDLLPAMRDAHKVVTSAAMSEAQKFDEVIKIAGPFMTGMSKLSDADFEFVLHQLLAAAELQQAAGNWAQVSTGTMLMMQDLELPVMLQIAGRAFAYNLSGFFSALPHQ